MSITTFILNSVPPATLKTILEYARYAVVAVNPYCWVMMRGDEILQIPRLGGRLLGTLKRDPRFRLAKPDPGRFLWPGWKT